MAAGRAGEVLVVPEIRKAEITKIENRAIQKINESKNWLFEKINKINKPLARLAKREDTNYQFQQGNGIKQQI